MAETKSITSKLDEYLQTSQHKTYFIAAATVGFIVVIFVFGILPAYSAFSQQGVENTKREQVIQKLTNKKNILKTLTQESNQNSKLIEYFNTVMPDSASQEELVLLFNNLAINNGAYINNLVFKDEKTELSRLYPLITLDAGLKGIDFTVKIDGSQATLNKIVSDIEDERRIINIRSLNISRKSSKEIEDLTPDRYYTLSLEATIFYFENTPI